MLKYKSFSPISGLFGFYRIYWREGNEESYLFDLRNKDLSSIDMLYEGFFAVSALRKFKDLKKRLLERGDVEEPPYKYHTWRRVTIDLITPYGIVADKVSVWYPDTKRLKEFTFREEFKFAEDRHRYWSAYDSENHRKVVDLVFWTLSMTLIAWGAYEFQQSLEKERRQKWAQQFYASHGYLTGATYNAHYSVDDNLRTVPLQDSVTTAEGKKMAIGIWTGNDGDYKACRKQLLERFEAVYGQEKYAHKPSRITAHLDGNVLYLASTSFKDYYNRREFEHTFDFMFEDCKFAEVYLTTCYTGGADAYLIYKDHSLKIEKGKRKKYKGRNVQINGDDNENDELDEDSPEYHRYQ